MPFLHVLDLSARRFSFVGSRHVVNLSGASHQHQAAFDNTALAVAQIIEQAAETAFAHFLKFIFAMRRHHFVLRLTKHGFNTPLQTETVIKLDAAQDFRIDVQRIDIFKGLINEAFIAR